MPKPREGLPRGRVVERAVLTAAKARGGGCVHFRDDLVWGQDFYESVFDILGLTSAQLAIPDGAGRSKAEHIVRNAMDSLAKKGKVVHIRHSVWEFPKEDQAPETGTGLGWVPRRRPINAVRDRLCWVRP
jgi:hypothetical protein